MKRWMKIVAVLVALAGVALAKDSPQNAPNIKADQLGLWYQNKTTAATFQRLGCGVFVNESTTNTAWTIPLAQPEKDVDGEYMQFILIQNASTSNMTLTCSGSDTFTDGDTSITLDGGMSFMLGLTSNKWHKCGGYCPTEWPDNMSFVNLTVTNLTVNGTATVAYVSVTTLEAVNLTVTNMTALASNVTDYLLFTNGDGTNLTLSGTGTLAQAEITSENVVSSTVTNETVSGTSTVAQAEITDANIVSAIITNETVNGTSTVVQAEITDANIVNAVLTNATVNGTNSAEELVYVNGNGTNLTLSGTGTLAQAEITSGHITNDASETNGIPTFQQVITASNALWEADWGTNVFYLSPNGNDAEDGRSDWKAFQTFETGVAAVVSIPDGVLVILPGVYSGGNVIFDQSGNTNSFVAFGANVVPTSFQLQNGRSKLYGGTWSSLWSLTNSVMYLHGLSASAISTYEDGIAYMGDDVEYSSLTGETWPMPDSTNTMAIGGSAGQWLYHDGTSLAWGAPTGGIYEAAASYSDASNAATYTAAATYADGTTNGFLTVLSTATNETLSAANGYADGATNDVFANATNAAYGISVTYADAATNDCFTTSTNASIEAAQTYANGATNDIATIIDTATNECFNSATNASQGQVEAGTNGIYEAAASYTDGGTNALQTNLETGTNEVLTAANTYTDGATNAVLSITYTGDVTVYGTDASATAGVVQTNLFQFSVGILTNYALNL